MKNTYFAILLIVLIGCTINTKGQTSVSSAQFELVKSYTKQFPEHTQLSIAVINDNKVYFGGFIKSKDTLISVNNRDSVFEIGSITKIFTSTLLSKLILDGTFTLDEPIKNILPFPLPLPTYEKDKLSFKTLSNHTSGFPRMPDNYEEIVKNQPDGSSYDTTVLKNYLEKKLILKSVPGKKYLYSNFGYATLGYVIEHFKKASYEKLLQNFICKKYGLKSTTTDYKKIKDLVVSGQDTLGNKIPFADLGAFKPAGGILSSVSDLVKFVRANFNDDTLLAYQRRETYNGGNFGMALGWQIWKIGGNNCVWYSKNGGMDGYRSDCVMDLPSKSAVIVLSNLSVFHPKNNNIDKLAHDLLKLEYLQRHENDGCGTAFIEVALKSGWGAQRRDSLRHTAIPENSIIGVWKQNINNRIVTRTFFPDNKVQTDFTNNSEMDVWGYYSLNGDTIVFKDIGGLACSENGTYLYKLMNDTLHFIPVTDNCEGRKIGLSGTWTRMK